MPPKVIQYRDCKKFDYAIFNNNLRKQIKNLNFSELHFATLRKIFMEVLDRFVLLKNKHIKANRSNFLIKSLVNLSSKYNKLKKLLRKFWSENIVRTQERFDLT